MKKRWIGWICLLLIGIAASALASDAPELLPNGGFEEMDGFGNPVGWYTSMYRKQEGYSRLQLTQEKARSGLYSAVVENASENDARYVCSIAVEPNSMYRLSGYVLVESMEEMGIGANLAIEDVASHSGKLYDTRGEWRYVECYGETGPNQRRVAVGVRVGGYGAESVGRAFFDDISLVKVTSLPGDRVADLWYREDAPVQAQPAAAAEPQKSTALFVALGLAFLLALALCQRQLKAGEGRELTGNGSAIWRWLFPALMLAALVIRVLMASAVQGYEVDINCFLAWSLRMAEEGPVRFYAEGYFCDYPPGYILLLWPVGLLLKAVGLANDSVKLLVIKSIPILSDMAVTVSLFAFGRKRLSAKAAILAALLFAFNPAALVNGAGWGQVDTLLALLMLLTAYSAMKRNWALALPLYALGVLTKPQALLLAPVGGIWLLLSLWQGRGGAKERKSLGLGLLVGALVSAVVILPFAIEKANPLQWLFGLYSDTLTSYGYATLNTANLHYLLGANWMKLERELSGLLPLGTGAALLLFGVWHVRRYQSFATGRHAFAQRPGKESRFLKVRPLHYGLALLCVSASIPFLTQWSSGATYQSYGVALMAFVYLWVLTCLSADGTAASLPFYMALTLIGVYVLGIKIHERYLFAALPLLLAAYMTTGDRRLLWLFAGFSVTTFINTAVILENSILYGSAMGHLNDDTLGLNVLVSIGNLALCGFGGYISFTGIGADAPRAGRSRKPGAMAAEQPALSYRKALETPGDARLGLCARDWLLMGAVSLIYACVTFTNLGSMTAPQNGWVSTSANEQIVFELEREASFHLLYYAGVSYEDFSVSTSPDGETWSEPVPCEMRQGLCYQWRYAIHMQDGDTGKYLSDAPESRVTLEGRYLRLHAGASGLNLLEILVRDMEGNRIPMRVVSHTGENASMLESPKPPENLLDEQDTLAGEPGWFNGMYFDEIYHGRTAYEHLHGLYPYETTHPPLGKLMMAAGVAVFGMTPFGWRFAGALIGVLMLPALYLLAKQLLRRRDLAAFAMLLFAFDLMHFTQTRIATIDSFPVFFIILSYLCMTRYVMTDLFALAPGEKPRLWSRAFLRSLIPLALCGLCMGLAIASKWIGVYSALGLAALFFMAVYRQYRASGAAFDGAFAGTPRGSALGLRLQNAQAHTIARIAVTCGLCLVFFLAVPALIYYVSYIPYLSPGGAVTLDRLIDAQENMLRYHSTPGLGMDHFFQSPWYEWPFLLKPMWFSQERYEPAGLASTIMCMGNPLVFYVGALCMAGALAAYPCKYVTLRGGLRKRPSDGKLTLPVLAVGFLAQYLPWVLVPRSMYIYHYFASVPFIILATAWAASFLPADKPKLRKGILWGYVALAAVFFVLFFPFASGIRTPVGWLDAMNWLSNLYY